MCNMKDVCSVCCYEALSFQFLRVLPNKTTFRQVIWLRETAVMLYFTEGGLVVGAQHVQATGRPLLYFFACVISSITQAVQPNLIFSLVDHSAMSRKKRWVHRLFVDMSYNCCHCSSVSDLAFGESAMNIPILVLQLDDMCLFCHHQWNGIMHDKIHTSSYETVRNVRAARKAFLRCTVYTCCRCRSDRGCIQ